MGGFDGGLPLGLHVGKGFFAQVATVAPTLRKLVQLACLGFPIGIALMGLGPSSHFSQQGQTPFAVRCAFGLGFAKPSLHKGISTVASLVKAFPQAMVGQATLVCFFPLFPKLAQRVLQFTPTHGGDPLAVIDSGRRSLLRLIFRFLLRNSLRCFCGDHVSDGWWRCRCLQQRFGFGDELKTDFVSALALPALELSGGSQGGLHLLGKLCIELQTFGFERGAQQRGCA